MKEIYLILAHTPTFEKEQMLRSLVYSINKQDKRVMVISHTTIPKDIEDMCDYTIFDKENKLIYDSMSQYWSNSMLGNKKFEFINLKSTITILPVYKLLMGALSYLKTLNYELIHLLEYDCEINDFKYFNEVVESINKNEYGLIGIKPETENERDHLILPISFNLNHLSFEDMVYDEDYLLSTYKFRFHNKLYPITEGLVYEMLWSKFNIKTEDRDEVKKSMKINQNFIFGQPDKYCLHTVDGVLHFVHDNLNKLDGNVIDVIVTDRTNNGKTKTFTVPYCNCTWVNLEVNYVDATHIKIFVNNTLFRELDLTNPNDRFYIDSTRIIEE